ncbi:MAG: hypothetical protein KJ914_08430 [Gammaproteobacteria bacterium]|nr:hypothetical protein [Gammaproteobacteria bacterium]MBU1722967.1 hypothetical protein [Gammaproteobacteria bacterium]MBU2005937.1 hypothetical protein [Gammaproteobacteria bacterium]
MTIKHILVSTSVAALLAACSTLTPEEQMAREMSGVSNSSLPPMFVSGYHDGCQSGLSAGGNNAFRFVKDMTKASNAQYKQGWEDGFRVCQSRQVQRNNERNSNYDSFGSPWFPRTGVTIGVQL